MAGENEKLDPDILKAKMDILRARNGDKEESDDEKSEQPLEMSDLMSDVVKANKTERQTAGRSDIPRFDVTKRILSHQRNNTAAKRVAPGKTSATETPEPEKAPLSIEEISTSRSRAGEVIVTQPSYNKLIAEIVSRDISLLCRQQSRAS